MPVTMAICYITEDWLERTSACFGYSSTYHIKSVYRTTECKQNQTRTFLKVAVGYISRVGGHKEEMTH